MNHLCGLQFDEDPSTNQSWEDSLPEQERKALEKFQATHDTGRPPQRATKEAEFGIDEDVGIEGWRELDKFTLYRFLCADQLSNGKFQPDKSLDRLQRALQHRRESKADAVLHWWLERLEQNPEENISTGKIILARQSSSFLFASTTIASGSLSERGETLENVAITPNHQVVHPGFTSIDLAKYKRLRIRRFTGRDYEGQPVLFERLGAFLGSGNHVHFTQEEWMRLYIWDLERHFSEMRQAAKSTGKPIQKYVFCGDGQGIVAAIVNRSIWKVIPLLKAYKAVEEYYPEIASTIILFNVPKIATFFYKAVRSFLDPVTAAKISLYSTANYEEGFSSLMPLNAIPEEYGGTSKVLYPKTATG